MEPKNLLVLMSDEHSPKVLGCEGNRIVRTPHLDALAERGARFVSAYCNSPICIPARASFATGRHIHEIGYWDNADPYDGTVPSWHHRLRDAGHRVVAIGKLHFRRTEDDNGFDEEIVPMHVVDGIGDLLGLIRDELPVRGSSGKIARSAGPGESAYLEYDRTITREAVRWLREQAPRFGQPWALFVSWVCPHFPLTAPQRFFDQYPPERMPWPKQYDEAERPYHPFLADYARCCNYDDYFDPQTVRVAIASYYALCSFLDDNIGQVLSALEELGLRDDTRIVYTSDHGDNVGARGLWGKSTMYEEVARVPFILAGPAVPEGVVVDTPVSHVDCFPTFLDSVGAQIDDDLPGDSLFTLIDGASQDRAVLSEYHAMASVTGAFMLRYGRYKYVYYPAYPPQLFDLLTDPEELRDLGTDPGYAAVRAECEARLRRYCDPEEVDARAKQRQAEQIDRHGGRAAILARGDFGYTPAPGTPADFR